MNGDYSLVRCRLPGCTWKQTTGKAVMDVLRSLHARTAHEATCEKREHRDQLSLEVNPLVVP